jgi:hypothetical protein
VLSGSTFLQFLTWFLLISTKLLVYVIRKNFIFFHSLDTIFLASIVVPFCSALMHFCNFENRNKQYLYFTQKELWYLAVVYIKFCQYLFCCLMIKARDFWLVEKWLKFRNESEAEKDMSSLKVLYREMNIWFWFFRWLWSKFNSRFCLFIWKHLSVKTIFGWAPSEAVFKQEWYEYMGTICRSWL